MALADIWEMRYVSRINTVDMYLRLWWQEQFPGNVDVDPSALGRKWIATVLPHLLAFQSDRVDAQYLYIRRQSPRPSIPETIPIALTGLWVGDAIPPSSSLCFTAYGFSVGQLKRASYRIGGIAENYQHDGVLTTEGRDLAELAADRLQQDLVTIGPFGAKWRPIIKRGPFLEVDIESMQVRSALHTQRTRIVPIGTAI